MGEKAGKCSIETAPAAADKVRGGLGRDRTADSKPFYNHNQCAQ